MSSSSTIPNMSNGMKSPTGRKFTSGYGRNHVAEVTNEAKLAQKFCEGCPFNLGGNGFPGCSQGIDTSVMVPAGIILTSEITPRPGCYRA